MFGVRIPQSHRQPCTPVHGGQRPPEDLKLKATIRPRLGGQGARQGLLPFHLTCIGDDRKSRGTGQPVPTPRGSEQLEGRAGIRSPRHPGPGAQRKCAQGERGEAPVWTGRRLYNSRALSSSENPAETTAPTPVSQATLISGSPPT